MFRVLYTVNAMHSGGTIRQFIELINHVDRNIIAPTICTVNQNSVKYKKIFEKIDDDIISLNRRHKFDLLPLVKIINIIKEKKIHLIHTFQTLSGSYGLAAAKITGKPLVCCSIRDAKKKRDISWLIKKCHSLFADVYVANSEAGFNSHFKKWRKNFKVIYNSIDFSRFDSNILDRDQIKIKYDLNKFKNLVGMAANLRKDKDLDTFIKAAHIVINRFPQTGFIIVGDGPEKNRIEEKVKKMKINKNVIFTGLILESEKLINVFDIAVLLTNINVHYEGISNFLLESMALKIPVIATKGGGNEELIENNVTGVLVNPFSPEETARAIINLFSNEDEKLKIVDNSYKKLHSEFTTERYVSDYINIYRDYF